MRQEPAIPSSRLAAAPATGAQARRRAVEQRCALREIFVCVSLVLSIATLTGCAAKHVTEKTAGTAPASVATSRAEPADKKTERDASQGAPTAGRTEAETPAPKSVQPARAKQETPVISALMRDAEEARSAGDLESAAATLERAVRIEPRNPRVWNALAHVRLTQGQPGLAEQLAQKSALLAGDDAALIADNETVISESRRQLQAGEP